MHICGEIEGGVGGRKLKSVYKNSLKKRGEDENEGNERKKF